MTIGWNFPNNGYGQIRGISDAGIETFKGSEIESLAREICQNSLDARKGKKDNNPVHVEFKLHKVLNSNIPGFEQYRENIRNAYQYWKSRNSKKTVEYLGRALTNINNEKNFVLQISDFNTVGLGDPYGDSDDGWNALTKLDGGATKTGDKAGAFGIGKNATFCNSYYRLVFYRTLNKQNEKAAQGISRFISFPLDQKDAKKTMTTGFGYYGNIEGNMPVGRIQELDNIYDRTEIGTDIFIYGFNYSSSWEDEVICELLENFLMSINNNLLSVTVGEQEINKENLSKYIKKYSNQLKNANDYYLVLENDDDNNKIHTFEIPFHSMGVLRLKVYVDPTKKLNRKILITRSSGMKLFDRTRISKLISFTGILELDGERLNTYFRDMETPSHDKWVPQRAENKKQAEQYCNELIQWINESVTSLGEYSSTEEVNVEGLSSALQKEDAEDLSRDEDKKESLTDTIGNIEIVPRKIVSTTKGMLYVNDNPGKSSPKAKKGTIDTHGDLPSTRVLKGTRQRKKIEKHKGRSDPKGVDIVHEGRGNANVPIDNIRIIRKDKNLFRISFLLPRPSTMPGYIEVVTIGENGKANKLKISTATGISGCSGIEVKNANIYFESLNSSSKIKIDFSVKESKNYAMEVNVYEHY